MLLLDKDDPSKILKKTEVPLLKPEEDYEKDGDVSEVCFPCGALVENNRLYIYYGGADKVCAVASASMEKIMESLKPFKDDPCSDEDILQRKKTWHEEAERELREKKGVKASHLRPY